MKIIADLHTHTVASTHAYSTVLENARYAADAGLSALAVTDHTPASTDGPHVWHFHNLHKALPRELFGVKLIFGAESSIIDYDGTIDFPAEECAALDWIIASIHRNHLKKASPDEITRLYLGVAENPLVDVIGHCATVGYEFDYDKCLKKFKEYGKLVEINESSITWKNTSDNYREIIRLCKKYEVPVVVNSDAHFCGLVGKFDRAIALIEEQGFPEELVVNSDTERFFKFISAQKGNIFTGKA
ncbi:MAG: phosphatase [Oscillospiraceae bacterium]|nr:phosphatase [Oscillospiraceae bacterium]